MITPFLLLANNEDIPLEFNSKDRKAYINNWLMKRLSDAVTKTFYTITVKVISKHKMEKNLDKNTKNAYAKKIPTTITYSYTMARLYDFMYIIIQIGFKFYALYKLNHLLYMKLLIILICKMICSS